VRELTCGNVARKFPLDVPRQGRSARLSKSAIVQTPSKLSILAPEQFRKYEQANITVAAAKRRAARNRNPPKAEVAKRPSGRRYSRLRCVSNNAFIHNYSSTPTAHEAMGEYWIVDLKGRFPISLPRAVFSQV